MNIPKFTFQWYQTPTLLNFSFLGDSCLWVVSFSGKFRWLGAGRRASWGMLRPLPGDCFFVGGQGLSHHVRWRLAAAHSGWRCLANVSAAGDNVGGWRLRQRHRATTWLAADCGGWLNFAGLLRCGSSLEDDASDFLGVLAWKWRPCAWCSFEVRSTFCVVLAVRWRLLEAGQYHTSLRW
jgi:hypothetical protein